jgi:hypothetical protein
MFMIVKLILEVPTRQSPHGAFGASTEITIMAMFARERKNVAPEVAQAFAVGVGGGRIDQASTKTHMLKPAPPEFLQPVCMGYDTIANSKDDCFHAARPWIK